MESILLLIVVTIILCIYYIPYLIADVRNIKNKTSVFWLNTFFGWSGFGWLALIFYSSLVSKSISISLNDKVKKVSKRNKKK